MTDLRFDDVVETQQITGPDGDYIVTICKTCSKRHTVTPEAFQHDSLYDLNGDKYIPTSIDKESMAYVAQMRAWNCCHDGAKPLDGFPEQPELPLGFEFEPRS